MCADWLKVCSYAGYPAVGTHLCVYWPTEQAWFAGCLTAYDAREGLSKINYDDGDEEWLYLVMESYMISSAGEHVRRCCTLHWPSFVLFPGFPVGGAKLGDP